ncbi:MAG: AAA family ATPase [Bowdeniella nasicola]|nr:AAA family ATPase [Bowdeniella nasicola]
MTTEPANAWLVTPAAGQRSAPVTAPEGRSVIVLPYARLGELAKAQEPVASARAIVARAYENRELRQRDAIVEDIEALYERMAVGDLVVEKRGGNPPELRIGRITGPVEFCSSQGAPQRAVKWVATVPGSRALLGQLNRTNNNRIFTNVSGAFEDLRVALDDPGGEDGPVRLPDPHAELAPALNLPHDWLQEVRDLLEERRQLIIQGPPGTGKTYVAKHLATDLAGEGNVRLIQFHPSYTYEDFFEGFRPRMEDGAMRYELTPGPLRTIAAQAAAAPHAPHILIIDEINRADLASVFGELYYLLEYRDEAVALQYSPEAEFMLPDNLYLIGTMNTTDRSIALLDAAIRRRFPVVTMHPASEPVRSLLRRFCQRAGTGHERADVLAALNSRLAQIDPALAIGPSYLMRNLEGGRAALERIWEHDILPTLHEQLYGRMDPDDISAEFALASLLPPETDDESR